jgi:hypothetical protein
MLKITAMCAALVAASVMAGWGGAAWGSVEPMSADLAAPQLPDDLSAVMVSGVDAALRVGDVALAGPRVAHHAAAKAPELTLGLAPGVIRFHDFMIGHAPLVKLRERTSDLNWIAPASSQTAKEWAFIRSEVVGPDELEALGDLFDVDEDERPWSDTTTVHVLAPTGGGFVPFVTVAHEVDSLDLYERYGLGGGAQISLGKNTTIGTELIYFGDRLNSENAKETRMMAHLEIQF